MKSAIPQRFSFQEINTESMPKRKKTAGRKHRRRPRTLRAKAKKEYEKTKRSVKRSLRRLKRKL